MQPWIADTTNQQASKHDVSLHDDAIKPDIMEGSLPSPGQY
jgi:hypothetical protein